MDRAAGHSVRLKLTLSYAGFLMLAGAVLSTVGYFSRFSRGVHLVLDFIVRSHADLVRNFAPIAAIVMAFLLVFGLLGGWLLAGRVLAPDAHHRRHARPRPERSPTGSSWKAVRTSSARLADAFDAMLAQLEAHVAEQQRFAVTPPTNYAPRCRSRRHFSTSPRNDPNHDNGEAVDRLHTVNTRAIDLTELVLLHSRADQRSFTREHVDLSLAAEEATETLLPLAEKRGLHDRDLRRHDSHHRLTRSCCS